jgi:hypothetical protein
MTVPRRLRGALRRGVARAGRARRRPGFRAAGVDLLSDGQGNWTTSDGQAVSELRGCIDVDISVSAFTNTLPIRRLGLAPTGSAELKDTLTEELLNLRPKPTPSGRARQDSNLRPSDS